LAAKILKRSNLQAKIVIKTLKTMANISKSFAYSHFCNIFAAKINKKHDVRNLHLLRLNM